jgi:hypothetical protein
MFLNVFAVDEAGSQHGQIIPLGSANDNVVGAGAIVARSIQGGLHHDYRRVARGNT